MAMDSARSWVVIVLIGLVLAISHADRTLLSIAAPRMIGEKHISGTHLGLLLSAFSWTYTIFQLPAGWVVDRFGPKRVLAVAFVCWSGACAATGLAADLGFLIACRLLLGVFESPLHAVAHSTMATAFSDRRRGLAAAIYSKGTSLGPALGAMAGTYLMVRFGWGPMFIIMGLASLTFLIPWLVAAPRELDAPPVERKAVEWRVVRELLTSRAVWGVSLGYFGFLYLFYVYATWLPTYLAEARGLSTKDIAWMSSAPAAIALVTGPAAGWTADWLIGRGLTQNLVRKAAIGLGLLLCFAVVPAAFSADALQAAILFTVALAGESIAAANMLALPSAIAPRGHAGLVGALQQMMGGMGGIVSPIVTGVLLDATHDFKAAVLCTGAMLCLAAVSFLVITPKIERIRLCSTDDGDQTAAEEPGARLAPAPHPTLL